MVYTIVKPASEKQIAFATKLIAERVTETTIHDLAGITSREISRMIDGLMTAPRKASATVKTERPAPGFYICDGQIIKVQENQARTGVYAKLLVPSGTAKRGSWIYQPGLIDQLKGAKPATLKLMALYGQGTGTCGICGAELTNAESIERGIGPICASKF